MFKENVKCLFSFTALEICFTAVVNNCNSGIICSHGNHNRINAFSIKDSENRFGDIRFITG